MTMKRFLCVLCAAIVVSAAAGWAVAFFQHRQRIEKPRLAAIAEARTVYWAALDGGLAAHVGSASKAEIERIRTEIRRMAFPIRESVFRKLIPLSLKPKAIMYWDNFREDEKGRFGGMVEDYWLNGPSVLRVATAYYLDEDDGPYNCIERAEVIDPVRAYTESAADFVK